MVRFPYGEREHWLLKNAETSSGKHSAFLSVCADREGESRSWKSGGGVKLSTDQFQILSSSVLIGQEDQWAWLSVCTLNKQHVTDLISAMVSSTMSLPHNWHDGSRYIFAQKMEAAGFPESFVNLYQSRWHHPYGTLNSIWQHSQSQYKVDTFHQLNVYIIFTTFLNVTQLPSSGAGVSHTDHGVLVVYCGVYQTGTREQRSLSLPLASLTRY